MPTLLRIWKKDNFTVEFHTTFCGSLGYVILDGDNEYFHNNNFYPSKKAYDNLNTDDLIVYELIRMLDKQENACSEYHRSFIPEKRQKWMQSDRYQEFLKIIPPGTFN